MPSWNPEQYLKFSDHRLRPAVDLLARIPSQHPKVVYDLGCGPGNVTLLLKERWPDARVVGVDSSADMLRKARETTPSIEFVEGDIKTWSPEVAPDLIFSNATLHWLEDHHRLLPRLARSVNAGGVLAIQMPHNHNSPAQAAIRATAADGPWHDKLRNVQGILPVGSPADYYRILSPACRALDIWETEYLHILEGEDPVAEWHKGTALRPFLDALAEPERSQFFLAFSERVRKIYPKEADGRTLLPFLRIFIVAEF